MARPDRNRFRSLRGSTDEAQPRSSDPVEELVQTHAEHKADAETIVSDWFEIQEDMALDAFGSGAGAPAPGGDAVEDAVSDAADTVSDAASDAADAVDDAAEAVGSAVGDALDDAADAAGDALGAIFGNDDEDEEDDDEDDGGFFTGLFD